MPVHPVSFWVEQTVEQTLPWLEVDLYGLRQHGVPKIHKSHPQWYICLRLPEFFERLRPGDVDVPPMFPSRPLCHQYKCCYVFARAIE